MAGKGYPWEGSLCQGSAIWAQALVKAKRWVGRGERVTPWKVGEAGPRSPSRPWASCLGLSPACLLLEVHFALLGKEGLIMPIHLPVRGDKLTPDTSYKVQVDPSPNSSFFPSTYSLKK
jgi:hypothetical protein